MELQQNTDNTNDRSKSDRSGRCDTHGNNSMKHRRRKRGTFGFILVLVGAWWLLRRMDLVILPDWFFTWPMILIAIGAFNLIVHRFKNIGGYILIGIGSVFLLKRHIDFPPEFELYFWPVMVILIGLFILFKPRGKGGNRGKWRRRGSATEPVVGFSNDHIDDNEVLDYMVVMGGIKKDIISKKFKGGEVTCVMAGAELYFSKADFDKTASIELTVAMGGVKLVVPSHWNVILNTTNILGGVDDKRRNYSPAAEGEEKTLIINGTVIMGGIEINSLA